jgi:hypothetical protein
MASFSKKTTPTSTEQCVLPCPCVQAKNVNDDLAKEVAHLMKRYTGREVDATVTEQGHPYMISSDSSKCKKLSYYHENTTLPRFNRYRKAMPYANAALELNTLGDDSDNDKKKEARKAKCIEMLPETAKELNAELGLPEGTLTDADLRDDTTGFRAVVYRSEATGKLILVARDTQPDSLVDWKTNTDNGQGRDTDQYQSMRNLAGLLNKKGVKFDVAGYSKGGGLAQEAGLISTNSDIMVFNSAGLNNASLARTGQSSFDSLSSRTQSFSAEGDFLTFMNDTTDSTQQITNARFLRDELAGDGSGYNPMNIKIRNPAMRAAKKEAGWFGDDPDPDFATDKEAYLKDIDNMIATAEGQQQKGENFRLFPPVQTNQREVIPNSINSLNDNWFSKGKVRNENPNLAKLIQHKMNSVTTGLEKTIAQDKQALQDFIKDCG